MKRFIWVLLLVLFVTGTASAQQVDANITFAWDLHESAANVTGFRLYMSTTSGQYTYGAVNAVAIELGGTATQTGPVSLTLTTGTRYFFVLTAYNDQGESGPSNEVSHLVPDSVPPDAPYNVDVTFKSVGVMIFIEAEDFTLSGNVVRGTDAAASGGEFVWAPRGGAISDPQSVHYAEYTFTVPSAGAYAVWGRVLSPDAGSDSFWVTMDTLPSHLWDTLVHTVWEWQRVTDRAAGPINEGGVVDFNLVAGQHTLKFSQREDGTKLDRVLITDDLTYVP